MPHPEQPSYKELAARNAELTARVPGLLAVVAEQAALIETLRAGVAALRRQAGRDSSNSSQPPSQDGPRAEAKAKAARQAARRARPARPQGGQKDDMMRDLLSSAHAWCVSSVREREEVPVVAIVGGFDIHRRQVTFDYLDTVTGQVRRGRIEPACRQVLRRWLERFAGRDDVTFAVEGCTGWQFVVEELQRAGITALLAEPAETADLRGPKRRAKTDKTDARHLRTLVAEGRVPASWIPPRQACELRALLQLYRDLREEHTAWTQRIHATLFHQGVPSLAGRLADPQVRARLAADGAGMGLSPAGVQAVQVALRRMDDLEAGLAPVHAQIAAFARRQAGCKALARELYGVGPLVAAIVWAFLGDARRFSSSAQAVRHTGLDVTVYSSDDKRTPGHLSHQGPPILRWALFEAGHQGSRTASPDHLYYAGVAERIDANRAALSVARKLARRSHHILRRLGDRAYAPVPGW